MTHAFVRPAQPGRRRLLAGAGAAVLAVFGRRALAQSGYPSQAITVTVPYAPGGQGDVFARLLGERLGAALGQTMVVENRPGASGGRGGPGGGPGGRGPGRRPGPGRGGPGRGARGRRVSPAGGARGGGGGSTLPGAGTGLRTAAGIWRGWPGGRFAAGAGGAG